MDYEQLKTFVNNEIQPYMLNIEMWQCITALGIKPIKDGNQWSFLYGDNIQDGICGFGDTINEAALNFYTNLKSEKISQNVQKHSDKIETNFNADEKIRNYILSHFQHHLKTYKDLTSNGIFLLPFTDEEIKMMDASVAWLKKQVEQKSAWSEEDETRLKAVILNLEELQKHFAVPSTQYVTKCIVWLKSLKNRVQSQSEQEWSEEDVLNLKQAIYVCHQNGYTAVENWLKSLSQKLSNVERNEKDWKPTDEQIGALRIAIGDEQGSDCCDILRSLLKELKAL